MSGAKQSLEWVLENMDEIYVRANLAGSWRSVPLSALPAKDALRAVIEWVRDGRIRAETLETIPSKSCVGDGVSPEGAPHCVLVDGHPGACVDAYQANGGIKRRP